MKKITAKTLEAKLGSGLRMMFKRILIFNIHLDIFSELAHEPIKLFGTIDAFKVAEYQ